MESDKFCKLLAEESLKKIGIPVDKMYSAHFDYRDMVNRLNILKYEKIKAQMFACYNSNINDQRNRRNRSYEELCKSQSKAGKSTERSEKVVLPAIKTSKNNDKPKRFLEYTEKRCSNKKLGVLFAKIKSQKVVKL